MKSKVNRWPCIALLILLAIMFGMPVSAQTAPANGIITQTQRQLEGYTAELDQINLQLAKDVISQERVDIYDNKLKRILSEVAQIKSSASKELQQQEALLEVLGPAPKGSEPAEDEIAKQKREQTRDKITFYSGTTKLTDSLLFEIKTIQGQLVAISLENKAKGLLMKQEPLYDWEVWSFAWNDTQIATANFMGAYYALLMDITDFRPQQYGGVLLFYFVLAFYIGIPISYLLLKQYGLRRKDALPGTFRKLFTGVAQLFAKAILPLAAIWIAIEALNICNVISPQSLNLLVTTFIAINIILLSHFITTIALPLQKPSWAIFPLEYMSVKNINHGFCIFMILIALNWYIAELFEMGLFSIDFYLVIAFLLRVAVCFSGLMLLRRKNWVEKQDQNESSQPIRHHWVANGIKVFSTIVFVTNPFFILFGYLQLANAVFLISVEIILLILGLLASHHILKELLHRFFIGKKEEQDTSANVQKLTKKAALHYWTMLLIDFVFILLGLYCILIILGIDNDLIWRYIKPIFSGIKIGQYVFSINILLFAIFVFIVLLGLTRLIQKALSKNVLAHTSLDLGAKQAIAQGFGYAGITIAIICSLLALGINFTSLAIIAGALSVGIGFGLQHIVGNFISGIIMLIERPIKVGDRIIVGEDDGIVKNISVRATEIEDFEKSSILIPNSELISGRVQNWTFHTPLNRVRVSVGVAYGTDVRLVESLLLEVAEENKNVVKEPAPRVYFDDFGDSALIFRLMAYIYDIDIRNRTPSNLRFAIEQKFRENNIHIPFPQRDIHIKKEDS